jgi:L-ornithine Nalpha-acyltransferase
MAHEALMETVRYRARFAASAADLAVSLALRGRVFRGDALAPDGDGYDARCRHVLIEDKASGALLCSYRLFSLADGRGIADSYSAQFYELGALAGYGRPMVEVGRFCIAPEAQDGDVLRLAWAALTRLVDREAVGMLFGCSSFPGTEPGLYSDAFALLSARHAAPPRWRPRVKAPEVIRFDAPTPALDARTAMTAIPPLLRTYLVMGGWVSDHAVIDRDLGTLHVFTGLDVDGVPAARARALRGLVGV